MQEEEALDRVAWSALVECYIRNGRSSRGLDVLYRMIEEFRTPPTISMLKHVGRALEREGAGSLAGSLGSPFEDALRQIRQQIYRFSRLRGLDRDTAVRHLEFNCFLYFHLTLLQLHSFPSSSPPSEAARDNNVASIITSPASFVPSFLSRLVHKRQKKISSHLDYQRAAMILQHMEDEQVPIAGPLQRLLASVTSFSS